MFRPSPRRALGVFGQVLGILWLYSRLSRVVYEARSPFRGSSELEGAKQIKAGFHGFSPVAWSRRRRLLFALPWQRRQGHTLYKGCLSFRLAR